MLALDAALTPSTKPTCRWHPVEGVYGKLVRAGLVQQLDDDAQCWRLASILAAGSADAALAHPAPARTRPILVRRDFNPATALVDGKTSLHRGSGTTGGLVDAGFGAVSTCCAWSSREDRAEAISWTMCRLVASGAASAALDGKKIRPVDNPWTDRLSDEE